MTARQESLCWVPCYVAHVAAKWVEPLYSRSQVKKAGRLLSRSPDAPLDKWVDAFFVVTNWRSAHNYPLNALQNALRKHVAAVTDDALVAQRLKRLPSIVKKLERVPTMQLTTMQDIGGCRAVVPTVEDVDSVWARLLNSRMRHTLIDVDNYIHYPKDDGYRSLHVNYMYRPSSASKAAFDGLRIKVQIRSQLQHAWATAVETIRTLSS